MNERRFNNVKFGHRRVDIFFVIIISIIMICLLPGYVLAAGPFFSITDNPFGNNYVKDPYHIDSITARSFQTALDFDCTDLRSGWVTYGINERRYSDVDVEFEIKAGNALSVENFGKYQDLADDSFTITMMAVGTIVILYMSPENFSNWEEKNLSPDNMGDRYAHKVSDGPVVDKDDNGINYYGHPYFGGAYYIHSRHSGYTKNESFVFSFLMSTCMYEYGIEAFFERPSMQDIFVTPILGTVHGELMLFWERRIKRKGNKVAGSKRFGKFCLAVIDPIGFMINQIDKLSAFFPNTHIKTNFYAYQRRAPFEIDLPQGSGGFRDFRFGLEIQWFNN